MKITKHDFQDLIQMERDAQIAKWGHQEHPDEKWGMILLEEAGEVAKAVLEKNDAALLQEMVEVAAVLEAWITSRTWEADGSQND